MRASTDPKLDLQRWSSLAGLFATPGLFESAAAGRVAAIAADLGYSSSAWDQVRLYDIASFREIGRLQLPGFTVGANTYAANGRWVFMNAAGSVFVIVQADSAAGLTNDFAIRTFPMGSPSPCFASLSQTSISIPATGSLADIGISAAADCVYRAQSGVSWVQIVSGGYGTGNASMRIHARANTGAAARSGTVTLGTQTLTISQAGATATAPVLHRLSYKVAGSEYSKALNRIVAISTAPDELHIIDPVNRSEQFVPLIKAPLSVSVQPDGLKAAVGHSGFVSYVNLQTAAVERVYSVPGDALGIAAAGNGYVYTVTGKDSPAPVRSILLSSGAFTSPEFDMARSPAKLQPSRNAIYMNGSFQIDRWDISSGAAALQRRLDQTAACANFWLSEDGARIFDACGGVFRASDVAQQDGAPNGSLVGALGFLAQPGVLSLAHSSLRAAAAVAPGTIRFGPNDWYPGEVQMYADNGLVLQGRTLLTPFDNGAKHEVQGQFVFWNSAADRLFVISKVNPSAGLVSDYVIETVLPSTISGCAASLSSNSANISGFGGTIDVNITTGSNCVWGANLSLDAFWLSIGSGNPVRSTGSGVLTITVSRNYSSTALVGTLVIAGQQFTVNQAAPAGFQLYPSPTEIGSNGGTVRVFVAAGSQSASWTASSNVSWAVITSGSGRGDGSFFVDFAPNLGIARTAILSVGSASATITQDAGPEAPGAGMRFIPVTPCRLIDTRTEGPIVNGNRVMQVNGLCGIPQGARAASLNVTVVPQGILGYLTIAPSNAALPFVSTLNSFDGRVKANAAIVPTGVGSLNVFATDPTHVILDVNGYFIPAAGANTSTSHPFNAVKPCRVVDTRTGNGGSMTAGQSRTFALRSVTGCDAVPANVAAYSLNITAIPKSAALGYLTTWGAGGAQPFVSTLNSFTGTVVANAAIVPAGTNGDISVFVTDAADVVVDINGYFGPGGANPLLYYPRTPCRISDSRQAVSAFGGPVLAAGVARSWPIPTNVCGLPANAAAYVLNATVVPNVTLGYLTLWPSGAAQPFVSTLNSFDGSITANAAIVPAGVGGAVSSFVSDASHLILDTTGYFGQ